MEESTASIFRVGKSGNEPGRRKVFLANLILLAACNL
jgi:hypothetical protein